MEAEIPYRWEAGLVLVVPTVAEEEVDRLLGALVAFPIAAVRLDVGRHSLGVHAFVCRKPDENFEGVYRWMLERNMKMYAVAFALDPMGDIYLDARLPLHGVTTAEIDRLLGAVLEYADGSFNTILELGFASSIRKEWDWRVSRGEPTRNLDAFRGPLGLDSRDVAGS